MTANAGASDAAGLGRARAVAFVTPAFLLIAAFLVFPAVWTIWLGMTDFRLTGARRPTRSSWGWTTTERP